MVTLYMFFKKGNQLYRVRTRGAERSCYLTLRALIKELYDGVDLVYLRGQQVPDDGVPFTKEGDDMVFCVMDSVKKLPRKLLARLERIPLHDKHYRIPHVPVYPKKKSELNSGSTRISVA